MARIIENEGSATFNDVESFIHFEVSVNRDTYADQDLLGSRGETVGALTESTLMKMSPPR